MSSSFKVIDIFLKKCIFSRLLLGQGRGYCRFLKLYFELKNFLVEEKTCINSKKAS